MSGISDSGLVTTLPSTDPQGLQRICDRLGPGAVKSFFWRWQRRLPSPLTREDLCAGYVYELAFRQFEVSDTRVFDRPAAGRAFFEQLIRDHLDVGRPDSVSLIINRRIISRTPGTFRTRVLTKDVDPQLNCYYKSSRIKQYFKDHRALRTETVICDTRDFGIGQRVTAENWKALRAVGEAANQRLCDAQAADARPAPDVATFTEVTRPSTTNGQHAPGLRFGDPRVMAVLAAIVGFTHLLAGFDKPHPRPTGQHTDRRPLHQSTSHLRPAATQRKGLIVRLPGRRDQADEPGAVLVSAAGRAAGHRGARQSAGRPPSPVLGAHRQYRDRRRMGRDAAGARGADRRQHRASLLASTPGCGSSSDHEECPETTIPAGQANPVPVEVHVMLDRDEIDALFPPDLPSPEHWEERYPPRNLPPGAMVTRFCPSPTGFAHLGGVYVAMLDKDLAQQSGGDYFIRIEDTDQARTVEDATAQFDTAFGYFGVTSDETDETGAYGPYTQSERARIYLTYVREFLRDRRAYLCFATKQELAAATEEQRAEKVPTGYYGRWAIWRDATDEQVRERLAAGQPYVVRFRSEGEPGRITYTDLVRGALEGDANRNDVVILKSSDSPLRLPTYHFAHVVDDHLMRVTHVIRGDEWISSVPVHLQLFDAAGFKRIPYAHIAPLLKLDGSAKRKLSKRKDPEASVEFYVNAGYPVASVLYYLRGLINGRLAEMPLAEALTAPLHLAECGVSGALVDLVKLEDIAADYVATLPSQDILGEVLTWADTYDTELAQAIRAEQDLAVRALDIERIGVTNPRKDLRKWSDFRPNYGYFFTALFEPITDPADSRLGALAPDVVRRLCADLLRIYHDLTDADAWFDQIRMVAKDNGFAASVKEYKNNRDSYVGSIREASQMVRVLLTGSTRSPALHLVANTLGEAEVRRRIGAVLDNA